ncbi:MAG: hypothetical protein H7Y30_05465 [Pyrinomonadaceae bacterium]|nr:hypothetical protein [Pyrinomonadaceae bacterium]
MPKKQSTKRTQVKDLPQKEKKLSAGDMKKVKGGAGQTHFGDVHIGIKAPEKQTGSK